MDINKIFELDLSGFVPDLSQLLDHSRLIVTLCVLVGPIVLLVLGALYLLLPPKEANHKFGIRTYYGMGSVEAWRFTQKVGGGMFVCLGIALILAMLVVVSNFSTKDPFQMVMIAAESMLWQAGSVLVARFLTAFVAAIVFDSYGDRRREKRM